VLVTFSKLSSNEFKTNFTSINHSFQEILSSKKTNKKGTKTLALEGYSRTMMWAPVDATKQSPRREPPTKKITRTMKTRWARER
jgi:hypothetical protein